MANVNSVAQIKQAPWGSLLFQYLVAVVAAETGNQKNPDNPFTAIVVTTAVSAKDAVTAAVVATAAEE